MLSSLITCARRIRRASRDRRHLPHAGWRAALAAANVPVTEATVDPDGTLYLLQADLRLPYTPAATALLCGARLLAELRGVGGVDLSWAPEAEVIHLRHDGVTYAAGNAEELWILRELLVVGDYDLLPSRAALIVDIGANVGLAALYLAHACTDALVVGYEPLEMNLDRAQRNLALNPEIAARIELVPAGLLDADGTRTLRSLPGHRGRSSMVTTPSAPGPIGALEEHTVSVRRASSELARLRQLHPARAVVLKLDCEGAESAIVDDLAASGELAHVDACLLEWHTPDGFADMPERLRERFHAAGFHVHVRGRHRRARPDGMMLAIRGTAPESSS
jgi:FkbM family methyltransferase